MPIVCSGVKRWGDPATVQRWVGTGMIEAQRSSRRIKGYGDMQRPTDTVRAEVTRVSPKARGFHTSQVRLGGLNICGAVTGIPQGSGCRVCYTLPA